MCIDYIRRLCKNDKNVLQICSEQLAKLQPKLFREASQPQFEALRQAAILVMLGVVCHLLMFLASHMLYEVQQGPFVSEWREVGNLLLVLQQIQALA